jgi:hypothetical protein
VKNCFTWLKPEPHTINKVGALGIAGALTIGVDAVNAFGTMLAARVWGKSSSEWTTLGTHEARLLALERLKLSRSLRVSWGRIQCLEQVALFELTDGCAERAVARRPAM